MGTFDFGNLVNIANKAVNFGLNVTKGVAKTVIKNSDFNWLSGGKSDSFSLSSKNIDLNNIRESMYSGLCDYTFTTGRTGKYNRLVESLNKSDLNGLPEEIHKNLCGIRKKVLTSGDFGEFVYGALNAIYEGGKNIPVVGDIVTGISQTIKPENVKKIINTSLDSLEKNFFEKIETNPNYQEFQSKVFDVFSPGNIVRIIQHISDMALLTGIAMTKEGGLQGEDITTLVNMATTSIKTQIEDGTIKTLF